jgi:hypothetical protein
MRGFLVLALEVNSAKFYQTGPWTYDVILCRIKGRFVFNGEHPMVMPGSTRTRHREPGKSCWPLIVKGLFLGRMGTAIRNICSVPESSLFPDKE